MMKILLALRFSKFKLQLLFYLFTKDYLYNEKTNEKIASF